MTRIEFKHIHDIIVNTKENKTMISIRDIRGSDVDIILSEADANFLKTTLNERSNKNDPEQT